MRGSGRSHVFGKEAGSVTDVYFFTLSAWNLGTAIVSLLMRNRVHYFSARGRIVGRLCLRLFPRRFGPVEYELAEFHGLHFRIHRAALEAAEELYGQVACGNSTTLGLWARVFQSDRVHLYVKKFLAREAYKFIKAHMVLTCLANQRERLVRLVVPGSPLMRLLVPFVMARYGDPRVEVKVLGGRLFGRFSGGLRVARGPVGVLAALCRLIWRRGLVLRNRRQHYKIGKEIIWGIGPGAGVGRKRDDFLVDNRLIHPEDMVLYYRNTSRARQARPEFLDASITAAGAKGYRCVNFDRVPVPVKFLWGAMFPRYVAFAGSISLLALTRGNGRPSAILLHDIVMNFLRESMVWEVFLSAHLPRVNLSIDDYATEHIAATVALNLYGCQNAGYQFSDQTAWKDVYLAYLGYNVYFAWGPLVEKYWRGNWGVDRVVEIGYLWGHHYLESWRSRQETRKSLLGNHPGYQFLIALFDEKPNPDHHLSKRMLFDFYGVGMRLLEARPDTVVVIRPKKFAGVPDVPEVRELLQKHLQSGRLKIWDMAVSDAPKLIAASDVVVSLIGAAPYLEAICCGRIGFNYDPTGNHDTPLYDQGYRKVIFDDAGELLKAIDLALDNPSYSPTDGLEDMISDLDPHRDFQGIDRMRDFISRVFQ